MVKIIIIMFPLILKFNIKIKEYNKFTFVIKVTLIL